jgi:hypothetical protein
MLQENDKSKKDDYEIWKNTDDSAIEREKVL